MSLSAKSGRLLRDNSTVAPLLLAESVESFGRSNMGCPSKKMFQSCSFQIMLGALQSKQGNR